MKNLNTLDKWRIEHPAIMLPGGRGDATCGAFRIRVAETVLQVIASSEKGWDHVSVSLPLRCPTWVEMNAIKRLFFKDTEAAMQLHPSVSDQVNLHNFCLHLWRPLVGKIPMPPKWMV